MRYLRRIRADQSYFQDCMVFWYTYHENIDGMHESHQGPFQFPISRLIEWLLHDDHLQLGRIEKTGRFDHGDLAKESSVEILKLTLKYLLEAN